LVSKRCGQTLSLATILTLVVSCASGPKPARVAVAPTPPPAKPAADPVASLINEGEAALRAGLAAADEGHLDRARAEFDRAIDLYLSYPGGAYADPRVAEAYRRALDTVQMREVEMVAAGDGFREAGIERASIDDVGSLPVGTTPPNEGTREKAQAAVAAEDLDLPIELNEPVLSAIDLYQTRLRDWFEAALSRGQKYLPHIRQIFKEEGIPQDLAYVALVESAFKPTAFSRAKARGVWQFISATGKRYGLQQDWWVDERSDPEKATRAAARYLKELFGMFDDWNLALAGYNAGEMKIVRGLQQYNAKDFWELRQTRAIRAETKNYVPLIHAAVILAKSPERYGFTIDADQGPEFEKVAIEGAYDLRAIAECAGEPVEDIRALNPELRRMATPADRTFALRVPAGRSKKVSDCVVNLPPEKRVNFRTLVVRRGQTLAAVARANGVRARDVADANGLSLQARLKPGTELIIPVPARPRLLTARHERGGNDLPEGRRVRYRVKPGDTLMSIAAQYGTTVQNLQAWNRLRSSRIAVGGLLTIYTASN
jgi:membrane-bound lytic murein transglycosylase D